MNTHPKVSPPKKLTNFKHVNLYTVEVQRAQGTSAWIFASRKDTPGNVTSTPDAVVIIAVVADQDEARLVLTREYRVPLGRHEISVPSGLVDPGETAADAARREMREETGMELIRMVHVSPPVASSAGLTDETVSLVYAEASGAISKVHQTEQEDIETRLVTIGEIRELLRQPSSDVISSRLYPILLGYATAGVIALPTGLSC